MIKKVLRLDTLYDPLTTDSSIKIVMKLLHS
nr:MAG TPA: hypothetical protein [Caudoviricetes sp.]